jgi:hypothetical protein
VRQGLTILVALGSVATAALPAAASAAGSPTVITVTAGKPSENAFLLSRTSVKRGKVVFEITNAGRRSHSFSIDGQRTKLLQPHRSATLTVVFRKRAHYFYSDTCVEDPNAPEMQTGAASAACAGGILRVT